MLLKEDWKNTKQEFAKWWNGQQKKPLIQILCPRSTGEKDHSKRPAWDSWEFLRYMDEPQKAVDLFEEWAAAHNFLGEAYPNLWLNLGPGVLAAYITGHLEFRTSTAWFEYAQEWDNVFKLLSNISEDNKWWQYTLKIAELSAKRCQDKYVVGMTDLGGVTDILASLRGTERLLIDVLEETDNVIHAQQMIVEFWHRCYDVLYNMLSQYVEVTSAWMGLWCPGRWYPLQCDFAAMISSRAFEKVVLPYLEYQTQRLDYSIYHLDGPGEIPHLDILLNIKRLNGIQWVPGAGNENVDSERWLDLYRRIQAAGKLLVLQGIAANRIPWLFERISPEGVLVSTYCSTEEEAYRILEWREKTG